jgi:hypothetical protein
MGWTLARSMLEGGVIQPFDLALAFRIHAVSPPSVSRLSQTSASSQSRITVSDDVCSTAAVSSTVRAAEETQFHYLALARVEGREAGESFVQGEQAACSVLAPSRAASGGASFTPPRFIYPWERA